MPVREGPQLGKPGHRAVIVEDLGHHAGRGEPGQPGQIHRGLGVPGPAEHPAFGVAQREDMPGPDDLIRLGRGVDKDPHGPRPVRGGDAGGDAVAGVHADRERGPHMLLVVAGHRGQLQPVQVFTQHGRADQAAGVPDRERHQLRRGLAGREHDVALVLPVRVVHHHDRAARRDLGDSPLDAVEGDAPALRPGHDRTAAGSPCSIRSTYLPITSVSRLTPLPGGTPPRVVAASVAGMRLTSNQGRSPGPPPRADTVRLTPSTAIEPFSTRYRARPGGTMILTTSQRSPLTRVVTVPTPSTWPWT